LINSTNPELTCDFENGLCGWLQEESRDSEDWLRNKGFTKSQLEFIKDNVLYKTGPQDTNNARKGNLNITWASFIIKWLKLIYLDSHYVYLNSYEQSKAFANAILISPLILTNIEKVYCMKFFYHMYAFPKDKNDAPIIGTLSLKLRVN
jgi:hypothetical protein